jgi:hypothetical protein
VRAALREFKPIPTQRLRSVQRLIGGCQQVDERGCLVLKLRESNADRSPDPEAAHSERGRFGKKSGNGFAHLFGAEGVMTKQQGSKFFSADAGENCLGSHYAAGNVRKRLQDLVSRIDR